MRTKKSHKLDHSELLNQVISWARDCGKILNKHLLLSFEKPIQVIDKGEHGLATLADIAAEDFLISKIKKHYPDHQILSEEDAFKHDSRLYSFKEGYTWVIDPLDGTNNFYNKIPMFAVSIGILYQGKPVVGVVFNPVSGDLFYAVKGVGSWQERVIGKKTIRKQLKITSKNKIFKESLLSANLTSKRIEESLLRRFPEVRAMRRFGSAALEMSFVAAGMLEAYWEYNLQPWDMAAAGLICQEAGAKISTLSGDPYSPFHPSVIVCHSALYKDLMDVLSKK
jgi:myo-inositol-1(or 4)-monophosphatase